MFLFLDQTALTMSKQKQPFAGDRVAVRKSPAGGWRQRGLVLLNVTSAFTEPHNRPLLLLLPSFHTTTSTTASTSSPSSTPAPPVSVKGQRRGGSSPPPTPPPPRRNPRLPLHNQPQHWSPVPGNSIKEGLQRTQTSQNPPLSPEGFPTPRLLHM